MSKLKAIHNHIIFQMEGESVRHMGVRQFQESTDWGFTYVRVDDSTQSPRWGRVVSCGPDVFEDIKVGMRILIEPLKWTEGIEFEGEMFWRTDSDCVLGYDEDHMLGYLYHHDKSTDYREDYQEVLC